MKTIYKLILCSVAFAVFASCEKREEISEGIQTELTARIESYGDTRTSLSDLQNGNYYPLWSEGDEIAVYADGDTQPSKFVLQSGQGTTEAVFRGMKDGTDFIALYPFGENAVIQNGVLGFSLPAKQQYAERSFGQGSYPMIASGKDGVLNFKNLCSVIKISLYGKETVKNITLTANDKSTFVSGNATVQTIYGDEPELVMSSGGSNSVILECTNGVGITEDNATDFCIVIPAQTYKGGLTLSVATVRGTMEKTITKDLVFDRSQLREVESFEFRLEGDVDASGSLQGEGTLSSPFEIYNLADLLLVQEAVNSQIGKIVSASTAEEVDARSAHYRLMADMDLSGVCGENIWNWKPIGDYSTDETYVFSGVFDGDGHSVKGLYIVSDKMYQGFFGCLSGVIKNLSVEGIVVGNGCCGIICGSIDNYKNSTTIVSNCISRGSVKSGEGYIDTYNGFGGIIGEGGNIYDCTNYATLDVKTAITGGITGSTSLTVKNCTNYGSVSGNAYIGGIIGYENAGELYNSSNKGRVTGNRYVGGLAGYSRQGAKLYNCYNLGDITGGDKTGGIVGMCDTDSDRPLQTKVKNCVNAGTVESSSQQSGGICGYNVSEVTNCYWLDDGNVATGVGELADIAVVEGVFALSAAQMSGEEDYPEVLYTSPDNTRFRNILDALNAFAYDNSSSGVDLDGWVKSKDAGCPVLSDVRPEKPEGENDPVFEVSVKEITVPYTGGIVEVSVKANMDYYISSLPSWITETSTKGASGLGTTVVHKFEVTENTGSEDRTGVIVFCNETQQCIPVSVTQKAKSEDDDWIGKTFFHKSLGMRFTADWCGYCPMMATAFEDAKKQLPGNLEVLSLHASGGLHSPVSESLANQFEISGFPTGYVDGRVEIPNYSNISYTTQTIVREVGVTEANYETVTGASWSSAISGNKVSLNLRVYFKASGSYKVSALLVEDNIVGYQNGASDSYVHKDVVRAAFTNALGEKLAAVSGQVHSMDYTIDIPAGCNKANLRIVVYVQREESSGVYYVNNAASAAVGKQQPLMIKSHKTGEVEGIVPDDDIPYNN